MIVFNIHLGALRRRLEGWVHFIIPYREERANRESRSCLMKVTRTKKASLRTVSYTQIPKPRLGIFFELFLGFMI